MTIKKCLGEPDCVPSTAASGWTHHALCPSSDPDGCGTCDGFGYLDDEDETECPTCEGRGVQPSSSRGSVLGHRYDKQEQQ